MKESRTRLPDLSHGYSAAMVSEEIKLDGQKILFDKKVSLLPVPIKKEKTSE